MTLLDPLFVLLFAILFPLAGFSGYQRLLRRIHSGSRVNRLQLYRYSTLSHWILLAMALVVWSIAGRSWQALGLSVDLDSRFWLGATATLAGIGLLVVKLRQVSSATAGELAAAGKQFGKLAPLIPRNRAELARYYGLSVTAGIVEEILWRGFLTWYLAQYLPLWAAASIGALGFGLAHAYQGWGQVPMITLVGAAFTGLYLLTGSVWLPIVLHIAIDVLQGRTGYEVGRLQARLSGDAPR